MPRGVSSIKRAVPAAENKRYQNKQAAGYNLLSNNKRSTSSFARTPFTCLPLLLRTQKRSPVEAGLDSAKIFLLNQGEFSFKLFDLFGIVLAVCIFCCEIIVEGFQYVHCLSILYLGFFGFTIFKIYFA